MYERSDFFLPVVSAYSIISFLPHNIPIAIPPPAIFPKVTISGSNFIVGYKQPYLNLKPVTISSKINNDLFL